jgi:hypothetical protein
MYAKIVDSNGNQKHKLLPLLFARLDILLRVLDYNDSLVTDEYINITMMYNHVLFDCLSHLPMASELPYSL